MDTLTNWDPNHYSWLERKFLKILGEMRIRDFQHNYKVEIPDQNKVFYIDWASPTLMLGFEVDSKAFHSGAAAKSHDEWRQDLLEQNGWQIIRFRSEDILLRPESVKQTIRKAVGETAKKNLATLG